MKTPDYLHSNLLEDPKNDFVFQRTHATINSMAYEYKKLLRSQGYDGRQLQQYTELYLSMIEDKVVELVNLTIHNFNKTPRK